MTLLIKKLHADAIVPKYALSGDAGMDLFALEETTFLPGERKSVRTGIALAIPANHVGLVWDKSSVPSKFGMHCLAGVLDETYRGEILVVMINHSPAPFTFAKGQKIAQLLIQPIAHPEVKEVQELDSTIRGSGGFGSTGTHSK